MFKSRKRSSSQPLRPPPPATTAATTAAAQAFLANRVSNANLSAAAAATALRSITSSPTPVGEIQTKRMIRRQVSNSSAGSAPGGPGSSSRPGGGLQRRGSAGSMTERSFRDPSPARTPSLPKDAPPLPKLPTGLDTKSAPDAKKPARRIRSPAPTTSAAAQQTSKVAAGRETEAPIANIKKPLQPATQGSPPSVKIPSQTGNRSSVNFSRPMSPTNSPPLSPISKKTSPTDDGRPSYDSSTYSEPERENTAFAVKEAASAPVKKKKKRLVPPIVEGSHLESGGSTAKPRGTAVDETTQTAARSAAAPEPESSQALPASAPKPKKKNQVVRHTRDESIESQQSYRSDSDLSEQGYQPDRSRKNRASGILAKQPSIVREDQEAEEIAERATRRQTGGNTAANGSATSSLDRSRSDASPQAVAHQETSLTASRASLDERGSKRNSFSPSRTAHFSSSLVTETPDAGRHRPPSRSISPGKSAMKHSPSPRGPSPNYGLGSETSDADSNAGDRLQPRKRKGARVSFDDEPVVVGQAAEPSSAPSSPIVASPQSKRTGGWFSFGRKSQPVADEEDEMMKPRPALPSFGSVRNSKEIVPTVESTAKPRQSNENGVPFEPIRSANDHAIGGILANHFATTTHPEPTSGSQEPLAPEVTSVEGSGYQSADDESDEPAGDKVVHAIAEPKAAKEQESASKSELGAPTLEKEVPADMGDKSASIAVPIIEIQPATPGLAPPTEVGRDSYIPEIPGGWRRSMESVQQVPVGSTPDEPLDDDSMAGSKPSTAGIAEPDPLQESTTTDSQEPSQPIVGNVSDMIRAQTDEHTQDHHGADLNEDLDEDEDSSDSIYSDAAEDVADLEGDGFGSINAILESPLPQIAAKRPATPPPPPASTESSGAGLYEGLHRMDLHNDGSVSNQRTSIDRQSPPPPQPVFTTESAVAPTVIAAGAAIVDAMDSKQPDEKPAPKMSAKESVVPAERKKKQTLASEPAPVAPPPKSILRSTQNVTKSSQKAPTMKKSMRDSATTAGPRASSPPTQMRTSMRGPPQNFNQPATRVGLGKGVPVVPISDGGDARLSSPQGRGALQKKNRPLSMAATPAGTTPPVASAAITTRNRRFSDSGVGRAPPREVAPPMPGLRRKLSDGSNSDSSFKKSRNNRRNNEGRVTMRRSMRTERPNSEVGRPSATRTFSIGSDPGAARRPFSSGGPAGGMRLSMRDNPPASARAMSPMSMRSSLRGSAAPEAGRAMSPARSLFSRAPKQPKPPKSMPKATPAPARKLGFMSSRFGDSSDDEDDRTPRRYQSRFADSSDEDEPAQLAALDLTPVRGIPRRTDEGDSTDLEDSDEEAARPGAAALKSAKGQQMQQQPALSPLEIPKRSGTSEGAVLASGSLRNANGNTNANLASPRSGGRLGSPMDPPEKKRRSIFGNLGRRKDKGSKVGKADVESAARRDTPLERSRFERAAMASNRPRTPPSQNDTPTDSAVATPESVRFVSGGAGLVNGKASATASPMGNGNGNDNERRPPLSPRSPTSNSGKLQRRNAPPARMMSDSWPLPPSIPNSPSSVIRPSTSDGTSKNRTAGSMFRSGGGFRGNNRDLEAEFAAPVVVVGRSGKKKRFPMLRKAFGLTD